MKIKLKSITHFSELSQETHCYAASLYIDGKKVGRVSNSGRGGADDFDGDWKVYEEIDAWVAANMEGTQWDDGVLPANLEGLCCELVNDHLAEKELKKLLKNRVLYVQDNTLMQMRWKGIRKIDSSCVTRAWAALTGEERKTGKEFKILNKLSFAEALTLFKSVTS